MNQQTKRKPMRKPKVTSAKAQEQFRTETNLRRIVEQHAAVAQDEELITTILELAPDTIASLSTLCLHTPGDCDQPAQVCAHGLHNFVTTLVAIGIELHKVLENPEGTWKN